MTRLYTRSGDQGETGLAGGQRLAKDSLRICAIGEIDELNSCLGCLASQVRSAIEEARLPASEFAPVNESLNHIQHRLFDLGGELAMPGVKVIMAEDWQMLEEEIDKSEAHLPPLSQFILPGGAETASCCHLSRSVCRRAERSLHTLHRHEAVNPDTLAFVNRLSDLLFSWARLCNQCSGHGDVPWQAKDKKA